VLDAFVHRQKSVKLVLRQSEQLAVRLLGGSPAGAPSRAGFVRANLPSSKRTFSNRCSTMKPTGSSHEPCAVELSGSSDSRQEEKLRWEP